MSFWRMVPILIFSSSLKDMPMSTPTTYHTHCKKSFRQPRNQPGKMKKVYGRQLPAVIINRYIFLRYNEDRLL